MAHQCQRDLVVIAFRTTSHDRSPLVLGAVSSPSVRAVGKVTTTNVWRAGFYVPKVFIKHGYELAGGRLRVSQCCNFIFSFSSPLLKAAPANSRSPYFKRNRAQFHPYKHTLWPCDRTTTNDSRGCYSQPGPRNTRHKVNAKWLLEMERSLQRSEWLFTTAPNPRGRPLLSERWMIFPFFQPMGEECVCVCFYFISLHPHQQKCIVPGPRRVFGRKRKIVPRQNALSATGRRKFDKFSQLLPAAGKQAHTHTNTNTYKPATG